MKKRFPLSVVITLMVITAALTMSITMVYSLTRYNTYITNFREREDQFAKLSEVDSLVRQNYFGTADETTLTDSIISGYLSGLHDTYAQYYTPEQYNKLRENLEGKKIGIGVAVSKDASGYIQIVEVFPDTPAAEAELQESDLIIRVDAIDLTPETYDQAVEALQGEEGEKVTLLVRRSNSEFSVDVTRYKYDIPVVEYRMLDESVGYIKIEDFRDTTASQFVTAIKELRSMGAQGLLFDVRGNGGGTTDSVVQMLDELLPEGDIFTITDKNGNTVSGAVSSPACLEMPMAVLVDGGTASASELFASALRDYGVAQLVGTKTFGKGVMQTVLPLSDGSAIKITTAAYNPPKSENFNNIGLLPDVEVELPSEYKNALSLLPAEEDTQLQKGQELLRVQISQLTTEQPVSSSSEAAEDAE